MTESFEHGEPLQHTVRRIIGTHVDAALVELTERIDDRGPKAVHEARKHCKQVRAAARLARTGIGDAYRDVNDLARDAARSISVLRDATALAITFRTLCEHVGLTGEPFDSVADELARRQLAAEAAIGPDHPGVQAATDRLRRLADIVVDLDVVDDGWASLGPGVARSYGRGRAALEVAVQSPIATNFHELRKRAKYSRYNFAMLAPAAPALLEPLESAFHDLTDALGDAHDLAVLGEWLGSVDRPAEVAAVVTAVDGVRERLEAGAIDLGRRLYVEPTETFVRRIGAYWNVWREHGDGRAVGGIAAVFDKS